MVNQFLQRTINLGKKRASIIADDEYIDKIGTIRCRKCHEQRRERVTIGNETAEMCRTCSCKKKEEENEVKKEHEKAVQENRKKIFAQNFVRYKDSSIKTDDKSNTNVSTVIQKYVENFDKIFVAGKGLVFYGGSGGGKTFAMVAILNEVAKRYRPNKKKLYTCYINTFSAILQELQSCFNSWSNSTEDYYNRLNDYDLIAIDDWGHGYPTSDKRAQFMNEVIFNIIDMRYNCKKPLLLTTTVNMGDRNNFVGTNLAEAYSRLSETCQMVYVDGTIDRRMRNASTRFIH